MDNKIKKTIPAPGSKGYSIYLLRRCLSYFAPYKIRILVAIIAMGVAALTEAATAFLIKPAMDEIFINKDRDALIYIPLAYIFVTLLKGSGKITQNYMMQSCGLKVLERLRDELYTKIIKLPLRFYEGSQIGLLMSHIMNDVAQVRASLPSVVTVIRQALTMIALLGVVFYRDPQLAILATLVLPIAFFPFIYFGRRMRKLGRKSHSITASVTILLQEILSGIRVVKAFATEKYEGERFDKENKRVLRIALKQSLAGEFSSVAMEIIGAIGISIVLFYGGLKVINGESTPGTFFSFVAGLAMLYDPVKRLSSANNSIQGALAGAERVFNMLDSKDIKEEKGGEIVLEGAFNDITFEQVTFCYNKNLPALQNINLKVHKGERLALVGPSGAGKSTFVNMIPRFYDPDSGCIKINGTNIREYTLSSLRHNISVVSQDNFLFDASIRYNIAYGQNDFPEEKLIEAAQAAYAHDFIVGMPDGYDSIIGERGVKLSGGQKQRITIARAIAKNAPLLILDEATSALDSESEKIVQKALENLMQGRTSIVIAHRLSTVINSDRILVMDQGEIAAAGTHTELLESSPLYRKLYSIQFGEQER